MNNEEKILELLLNMQSDIVDLKHGQKHIETKVDTLETRFDSLETRFDSLETRFDSLETKVDTLQTDMTEVKDNVRYLWEDIARHDKKLDKLAK